MKDVKIKLVPTEDNLVDPLTKSLSQQKHYHHMERYGIWYRSDWPYRKWKIVNVYVL
jgi:hypothetical protein